MNKLQMFPFLLLLICIELHSMELQASEYFMKKVQNCGLSNQNEINKFFAVVMQQVIDTDLDQTKYTHLQNGGIQVFQKVKSGWRSVIRKPNGRFDISSVGSETVTSRAVSRSGFLESLDKTYEDALTVPNQQGVLVSSSRVLTAAFTSLSEEKSKKEKKEKKKKKKEEKHLKKMEKELRKAQLASEEAKETAAAVTAHVMLHATVEPKNVVASRNDISVVALSGDGAVKSKKYDELLKSPDVAHYKQKAQQCINSNYKGLRDYLQKQIDNKNIKYSFDAILQNAVFEDNVPSKSNWTLHLDGNQRVFWLGSLNIMTDRQGS